jgi:NodT family efflux transporter outer membrane factor (OMF) lipoprotein
MSASPPRGPTDKRDAVRMITRPIIPISAAMLCAACATPAPRAIAPPQLPTSYSQAETAGAASLDDRDWYSRFGSTELDDLLRSAPAGNFDLVAAAARVRQAAARARGARAALLPQLDAVGSAAHFTGRSGGTTASETDWSALLWASYELDFWGKNQAASQASAAAATASIADRETILLTTRAGLASGYFTVLSLRERQWIAQQDLDTAREVLKVIEARHAAGFASNADLASQRAVVATAELVVPELEGQRLAALAAIAVLAGRDPEGFAVQATSLAGLAEPAIDAGLPSELLRRRPDILLAEAMLQAANANLAAARAALFPTIALTASGGVQNPAVQAAVTTLAGTGPTLVVGASLLQAIFDGGRRRALRDEAAAHADELLANYRSAIRNGLVDVESSLATRHSIEAQQPARAQALAQSQLAFDAARARYAAGSGDYLTLLATQRTVHAARGEDAQYRLARLQTLVNLAKALGGGWQAPVPPATRAANTDRK